MNNGQGLISLATELTRQIETKRDFIAPTETLELTNEFNGATTDVRLKGLIPGQSLSLTGHAHGQLAQHVGIPKAYYDRMAVDAPDLLADNVNRWLVQQPAKRLVRTLDGKVRSINSERFRPLDNFDLAQATLPALKAIGAEVVSAQLTETRMYIKAVIPALSLKVEGSNMADTRGMAVGDVVRAGICIRNSEVGDGTLAIERFVDRLACLNGMIAAGKILKKNHVGRAFVSDQEVRELLSDEARQADDKAFWLKVRDVMKAALDADDFKALVGRMTQAAQTKIVSNDLPQVIELTAKRYGFTEDVQNSVLRNLIEGGDLSQWGLVNAVTAVGNTASDYELSTSMERAGGEILELSRTEWESIAA